MKQTIAILFGGRSGEHEISIRSAKTVISEINPERYDVIPVCIDPAGRWLSPAESIALMPEETQGSFQTRFGEPRREALALTGDATVGGLVPVCEDCGKSCPADAVKVDCVFPVLHGKIGRAHV